MEDTPKPDDKNGLVPQKFSTELSREEFLRYVEFDLWNRFSERLWKVVAAVLAISAILGLLGVPYYIRSEVSSHLVEREKDFNDRINDVTEYSKLLASLRGRYFSERSRFDSDVLQLVNALNERQKSTRNTNDTDDVFAPPNELRSLISRPDFAEVLANPIARRALEVPDSLKGIPVVPKTYRTVIGSGFTLATGGKEPHPVKDGTYDGEIQDVKFRIVILEALRAATDKLQQDMLALGQDPEKEKRRVTVDSLVNGEFQQNFAIQLSMIANTFLNEPERKKFAQCQKLYTVGYKVVYDPAAPSPKTGATPS